VWLITGRGRCLLCSLRTCTPTEARCTSGRLLIPRPVFRPISKRQFLSQFARFFSSAQSGGARRPTEPEEDGATLDGERQRQSTHAFAEGRPDAEGVTGNVFEEVSFCAVYGLGMQRTDALFD